MKESTQGVLTVVVILVLLAFVGVLFFYAMSDDAKLRQEIVVDVIHQNESHYTSEEFEILNLATNSNDYTYIQKIDGYYEPKEVNRSIVKIIPTSTERLAVNYTYYNNTPQKKVVFCGWCNGNGNLSDYPGCCTKYETWQHPCSYTNETKYCETRGGGSTETLVSADIFVPYEYIVERRL